AEPGGFALSGNLQDDSAPALAFQYGGDLLQISPNLPGLESRLRRWAPCTGPLAGTVLDRVEPTFTTGFAVEPAGVPRWPEEVRIARGHGDNLLAVWRERPYCNIRFGGCQGSNGIMARYFLGPDTPGGPVVAVATVGD